MRFLKFVLMLSICLVQAGCMFIQMEKESFPYYIENTERLEQILAKTTLGIDHGGIESEGMYNWSEERSLHFEKRLIDSWKSAGVFGKVAYLDELSDPPDLVLTSYRYKDLSIYPHPYISVFSLFVLPDGMREEYKVHYTLENHSGDVLDVGPFSFRRILVHNLLSFPLILFPGWKMTMVVEPIEGELDVSDIQRFLLPNSKISYRSVLGWVAEEDPFHMHDGFQMLDIFAAEQEQILKLLDRDR